MMFVNVNDELKKLGNRYAPCKRWALTKLAQKGARRFVEVYGTGYRSESGRKRSYLGKIIAELELMGYESRQIVVAKGARRMSPSEGYIWYVGIVEEE